MPCLEKCEKTKNSRQFTLRILWDLMGFVFNTVETKTFFEIRNGQSYKEVNVNS